MRKLLAIVAMVTASFCSSTSYAGVVVKYLGTTSATVDVNKLSAGGNLVTSASSSASGLDLAAFNSGFVSSVSGLFDAYLVTTDVAPYTPVTFQQNVLGIIASNSFSSAPRDLIADFEAATGFVSGVAGNNNLALEIFSVNPANPDVLTVSGNVITAGAGFSGPDSFIAIVAVPEPSSLAIWGVCAVGAVVAGRRRLRKKTA